MNNDVNWAGWMSGIAATLATLWLVFKHVFSFVTRDELQKTMREMHRENSSKLDRIHERVDALWERRGQTRDL